MVAEHLRREILRGTLPPGTQLAQDEIALQLEVSATPVREAFGVLEAEGLLQRQPHRGVLVARVDVNEAREIYELRRLLEMHALGLTLELVDTALVGDLERITRRGIEAVRRPDIHRFRATSADFHERLVEACGSRIVIEVTTMAISRSLFLVPYTDARMVRITRDHAAIVSALRCGKTAQVARLLDLHLRATIRTLDRDATGGGPRSAVAPRQSGKYFGLLRGRK